jgi:hypothetical protein
MPPLPERPNDLKPKVPEPDKAAVERNKARRSHDMSRKERAAYEERISRLKLNGGGDPEALGGRDKLPDGLRQMLRWALMDVEDNAEGLAPDEEKLKRALKGLRMIADMADKAHKAFSDDPHAGLALIRRMQDDL